MTDTFKERAIAAQGGARMNAVDVVNCQNCGKPISQMGIAYLHRWVHNHSQSERCDAPSVAVPEVVS